MIIFGKGAIFGGNRAKMTRVGCNFDVSRCAINRIWCKAGKLRETYIKLIIIVMLNRIQPLPYPSLVINKLYIRVNVHD